MSTVTINEERLKEVLAKPFGSGAHNDGDGFCIEEAAAFVAQDLVRRMCEVGR